ncbi:helix-turn-helix domain-containing protein [Rhizobium laguerreae]|uniref:helix-turn-helix transcriptional regulator n=1 Tax=Rhizobium laguerreae TaxID=1076926 RepID=UPI00143F9208|nr:helix-turn-helix transcriptional regulator [Rhizobium laguerreae]NKM86352.1 helix-turn-helix domain-containing protein [Rhizobium laguerreae]
MNTKWGTLIRRLREDHGLSQREFAVAAKVNRSTLRRIEGGETSGEVDVVDRMLELLGYELDAIKVREPTVAPRKQPSKDEPVQKVRTLVLKRRKLVDIVYPPSPREPSRRLRIICGPTVSH